MTDELKAQINAAMEKTGGKASQAAKLLGLPPARLYNHLHNNPELRARWTRSGRTAPQSEIDTIHRPAPLPATLAPIEPEDLIDEQVALAMQKEDNAFVRDLGSLGITGDRLKAFAALENFHRRHYTRALDMIGGGISKLFTDLMVEYEKLTNALDAPDLKPEREMILRQDRAIIIEAMGKTFDRASKAALTQAVIKHKLESKKQSQKPRGYLKIEAQPGSQVLVKAENQTIEESPSTTLDLSTEGDS